MDACSIGALRTGPAHMQVDVSTQADLVGYESEDERMGRRCRSKRGTPYSKGDIREQYCINNKEIQVLESGSSSALFGCLSKHSESSCSTRQSFLSVCVGRVPSDENLQELSRQPLPRRPVDDLERSYMRRRPKSICSIDATRYSWIPEDEESLKPEHERPIRPDWEPIGIRRGHAMSFSSEHLATSCPAHYLPPPPPPPAGSSRTKHVSFARSHTLTAFDDAIIELRRTPPGIFKSQERLILSTQSMRKVPPIIHLGQDQRLPKKAPMKAQATQTGSLNREPPTYLSLSPRTAHRVKMVSQGAQTNGQLWNGRRLMKSYSEAGCSFGANGEATEKSKEHEALMRTQSEEPRSPYMKQMMKPLWPPAGQTTSNSIEKIEERKKTRSSRSYREIFIDFEPIECEKRSDQNFPSSGREYVSEQSMNLDAIDDPPVDRVDGIKVSLSSYSTVEEDETATEDPREKRHPFPLAQDSVDEEFHENLIYGGIFKKYSASEESLNVALPGEKEDKLEKSGSGSPNYRDTLQMTTLTVSRRTSPFASNDSLANDQKGDHSDGMWNESQSTVLQAESDNGEVSSRTPSKRQSLLLQHQQRSSIDTEVLEDDVLHSQSPLYSPLKQESSVPFVTIATVHHYESPLSVANASMVIQHERKSHGVNFYPASSLLMTMRESRKKLSPEKEEIRGATDISETSTTEGDYATAYDNSGTDTSSKRSARQQRPSTGSKPGSKEGSSFDSASSAHSFARDDTVQAVPSSPPPIAEEKTSDIAETEDVSKTVNVDVKDMEEQTLIEEKEETSGSGESSSSGSYSVDSGQQKTEWTDQDRKRIKRNFKLDLSDYSNEPEAWSEGEPALDRQEGASVSPLSVTLIKTRYTTIPVRRTIQGQAKKLGTKGNGDVTPKMVRSPAMPEGFRTEDWVPLQRTAPQTPEEVFTPKSEAEISSDESSCEYKITGLEETINGHSLRRQRRRAGGRERKVQGDNGPRRRPLAMAPASQQQLSPSTAKYCRSPGHGSRGSPRKGLKGTKLQDHRKNLDTPDISGNLKALSAESLRSVSPGSDSVFYNEGGEAHVLCHQCGREVEGNHAVRTDVEDGVKEIVQPPAGFADSPDNTRGKSHRYYKKQEKRFRSEERGEKRRHSKFRADGLRAKSEERGREKGSKTKLRTHARSIDASLERLRGADSNPSISESLTADEPRIYSDSYTKCSWICIVDGEPGPSWSRSVDAGEEQTVEVKKEPITADLTASEKEFQRKYQAATHRMVHRKSSMEMYRRMQTKSFGYWEKTVREKLEELLRLMLMIWSTQIKALIVLKGECDKKVVVRRKSGEFGFRIHGSRPVVVSAIEPDTPAETSGLEVGDIVLSVNGVSVLEASHSDVVKLAHAGSDTLDLEIARTSIVLAPSSSEANAVECSGFLHKRGEDGRWHQRWFVLKSDNCIYYYKSQAVMQPLGALMLMSYKLNSTFDSEMPFSFILEKPGAKSLELAANGEESAQKWKVHLERAVKETHSGKSQWLEKSSNLMYQPPSAVHQPDCFGHLTQLEDKWRRRYCVLKDAALLLYADSTSSRALAIACLQGYRVQSSGISGKRFSFEVIPPESKQKHFYFYTDTEMDKKRCV